MVPQLLPPVAATTIGTPTQRAPSDRNPAAAACGAAAVFTFYFVLLALCLPVSRSRLETQHTFNVKNMRYQQDTCTHAVCVCARARTGARVCRYTSGEQRKPDVSSRNRAAWWGRARQASSQRER